MNEKPKIVLNLTTTDKIIEAIGYAILILFWITALVSYSDLPETIPVHYNGLGEVDGYADKKSIFMLPIIGTFLFTFLTLLNRSPESFNYTVTITPENTEEQYRNATLLMRWLKVIVLVLFFMIDFLTLQTSKGKSDGLGVWFLPFTFGIIFIPMAYFLYTSYKLKK